ncbi:beta-1,6-N-acetylglucosaminyltransferase [Litoribacter populi]|uniref:beta-1,6-N-acetylglucosaminyltransferase n=1 Tax=Litoribacter populi TaxID=2598460 RepID=UPI0011814138|nr:beta-1,6-N-acetylglucosaminyltransferase [Litoribacter populi]
MNKIIYFIIAHRNPAQLERLIRNLEGPDTVFYIHMDVRTAIEDYLYLASEEVKFIQNRVACVWADYAFVQAVLNLAEVALEDQQDGMIVLLSGQDYPLQPAGMIRAYFQAHMDKNFINCVPIEEAWSEFGCYRRRETYKVNFSDKRADFAFFKGMDLMLINCLLKGRVGLDVFKLIFKKRVEPFKLYGGSAWWAINTETFKKIMEFMQVRGEEMKKYWQYTYCADESFFQSLLMELLQGDKSSILPTPTYVNWTRKNCELPVTFNSGDLEELKQKSDEFLFARKFVMDKDEEILDDIDRELLVDRKKITTDHTD